MSFDPAKLLNDVKEYLHKFGEKFKTTNEEIKPVIEYTPNKEIDDEVRMMVRNESGMTRLKELFTIDKATGRYPEVTMEVQNTIATVGIFGFIIGFLLRSKVSGDRYQRSNQLTVFVDKKQAQRTYYDFVLHQSLKGGLYVCVRFITFTGVGLALALGITAYNSKSSPFNYVAGLAISGGLNQLVAGPRAAVYGTIVGGLFGGIYGTSIYYTNKAFDNLYEQRRHRELAIKLTEKKQLQALISQSPATTTTEKKD